MKSFLLAAGLVMASLSVMAQNELQPTPEQLARERAEAYAKALNLSPEQTNVIFKQLLAGEEQVAKARLQMAELNAQVEATMGKHETMAEATLSKEDQAKLATLRKEGWSPCTAQCAPKGEKAAGCCAGGGKPAAAKAAPVPKPNATMK